MAFQSLVLSMTLNCSAVWLAALNKDTGNFKSRGKNTPAKENVMRKSKKMRKYILDNAGLIGKVLYGRKEFVTWDHGSWDHKELGTIVKVNVIDNLDRVQIVYRSHKTGRTESVTLYNTLESSFVFVREWRIPALRAVRNPYRIADKADHPKAGWVRRNLLRKGVGYHLWKMEDNLRIRRWDDEREAFRASL